MTNSEKSLKWLAVILMSLQEQYEFIFQTVVEMFEKALRGTTSTYDNINEVWNRY